MATKHGVMSQWLSNMESSTIGMKHGVTTIGIKHGVSKDITTGFATVRTSGVIVYTLGHTDNSSGG